MAAIDKTYVYGFQLKEAIEWARSIGGIAEYEDGSKVSLIRYIEGYNPEEVRGTKPIVSQGKIYILWNTPEYLDRWLSQNCPLDFVQGRLKEQYGDDGYEKLKSFIYVPETLEPIGKHVTPISVPRWKGLVRSYDVKVVDQKGETLVCPGNVWRHINEYLPGQDWYSYGCVRGDITLKSAIRFAKSLKVPVGSMITLVQYKYIGINWKLKVRK